MEIINAKWASVSIIDNGLRISLSKNKFRNNTCYLYEDVKIIIDNGILTLEGLLHKQTHLYCFDSVKFWKDELQYQPLPEDEYLFKEGYKNFIHKWKGIKSKYMPIHTIYSYNKVKRKEKTNKFSLEYLSDDITELNQELKSFNEFKEEINNNNNN